MNKLKDTAKRKLSEEDIKRLLSIRKDIKSKKPVFLRQDAHKKSLGCKWRRPKGIHSKMRLSKKGYCKKVTKGWKSPEGVRGLAFNGLIPYRIESVKDLDKISKNHILIISGKIGNRKRKDLLEEIKKRDFEVLNVKDVAKAIENIDNQLKQRKTKKTVKKEKTKEIETPKKESLTKKIEEEEKKSEDEQKKQEKKEFDKLLTKRV